jgi:hypothetical protein
MEQPTIGKSDIRILTSSTLKLLAAFFMLIDHIGMIFFPSIDLFRIIGRIAFPLFSFLIAEGCRYTRNPRTRFFMVLGLGIICETVYVLYAGVIQGNILLTFSLSILLIHALDHFKCCFYSGSRISVITSAALFLALLVGAVIICPILSIDYGIFGVCAPVLASLFDYKEGKHSEFFRYYNHLPIKVAAFALMLLFLVIDRGLRDLQTWCLLALPFLFLYNGRRGRKGFKYGFYIFYPVHLLLLEGLAMLIRK